MSEGGRKDIRGRRDKEEVVVGGVRWGWGGWGREKREGGGSGKRAVKEIIRKMTQTGRKDREEETEK